MNELNDNDVIGAGKFIKGDDIASSGPEQVTIVGVRKDTFDDDETKQILMFEDGRELTLNATRSGQLESIFGRPLRVSAVKGKAVELFNEKVNQGMYKGKNSVHIRAVGKAAF
jgi:hypothetical protein